jgi:hypothetical protein
MSIMYAYYWLMYAQHLVLNLKNESSWPRFKFNRDSTCAVLLNLKNEKKRSFLSHIPHLFFQYKTFSELSKHPMSRNGGSSDLLDLSLHQVICGNVILSPNLYAHNDRYYHENKKNENLMSCCSYQQHKTPGFTFNPLHKVFKRETCMLVGQGLSVKLRAMVNSYMANITSCT